MPTEVCFGFDTDGLTTRREEHNRPSDSAKWQCISLLQEYFRSPEIWNILV